MEAAGLAIGTVAIIKPLCTTIHNTLANYKSFGRDAERLRLRFSVSQTRLDAFEHVLFDSEKFPGMTHRLADHIPERTLDDVVGLFRQLYALLVEYAAVREQYRIENRVEQSSTVASTISGGVDAEVLRTLTLEKSRGDAVQQKAVGWARKALWVAFDKSSTEKLVSEFEAWTGRMQALLEAITWPMVFFQGLERIRKLENDADLKSAGLLAGVGVRKVLAAGDGSVPVESHAEEIVARRFVATEDSEMPGQFEIGELEGSDGTCLVEYKAYQPGTRDERVSRQRVVQLAALLHEAPGSDPGLRVLRCTHYFEDTPKQRFGLVYDIPSTVLGVDGGTTTPLTLAHLLDAGYMGTRPSLSTRIRLAHKLALCVQRLHAYSWLHKSLRSENILLLSQEEPEAAEKGSVESVGHAHIRNTDDMLGNPRIFGFEYSRQELDFSDRFGEGDIRRNIYRHPARWGDPTQRFDKMHDIYGE